MIRDYECICDFGREERSAGISAAIECSSGKVQVVECYRDAGSVVSSIHYGCSCLRDSRERWWCPIDGESDARGITISIFQYEGVGIVSCYECIAYIRNAIDGSSRDAQSCIRDGDTSIIESSARDYRTSLRSSCEIHLRRSECEELDIALGSEMTSKPLIQYA